MIFIAYKNQGHRRWNRVTNSIYNILKNHPLKCCSQLRTTQTNPTITQNFIAYNHAKRERFTEMRRACQFYAAKTL